MVGRRCIICVLGVVVGWGWCILLVVDRVMLLVLCLCVWHELMMSLVEGDVVMVVRTN